MTYEKAIYCSHGNWWFSPTPTVTQVVPEVNSFLRSSASALFLGLVLFPALPSHHCYHWGNLPSRGVGSQHRDQRGIKSHWTVSLLFSLISHLPLLSLETVLTDSSSCSGLTHVLLESQKEIILLCSVSLIQSLALGFPVIFEEWLLSSRIILSKSSTSYGPGGVGWDLSPGTWSSPHTSHPQYR